MLFQEMLPYIDVEGGLKRIRGNKPFYARMVGLFLNGNENAVFEECLASGDLTRAGDAAHGIKGVTGNLSFTLLYELSAKLTDQLRGGVADDELIAKYREAYVKTREYAQRVIDELT